MNDKQLREKLLRLQFRFETPTTSIANSEGGM